MCFIELVIKNIRGGEMTSFDPIYMLRWRDMVIPAVAPQAPSPKPQAPSPKPQAPSPKPQAPSPKNKKQEARSKKQEARSKKQEARRRRRSRRRARERSPISHTPFPDSVQNSIYYIIESVSHLLMYICYYYCYSIINVYI